MSLKNKEQQRGYLAALHIISSATEKVKAAHHHRDVACGDLTPDDFTKGWKEACDDVIAENQSVVSEAAK